LESASVPFLLLIGFVLTALAFRGEPVKGILALAVVCLVVLALLPIRRFWILQDSTYEVDETSITCRYRGGGTSTVTFADIQRVDIKGPFGERSANPSGGYAVTTLRDPSDSVKFSIGYVPDLWDEIRDKVLV
jgi:hypothetical protein